MSKPNKPLILQHLTDTDRYGYKIPIIVGIIINTRVLGGVDFRLKIAVELGANIGVKIGKFVIFDGLF